MSTGRVGETTCRFVQAGALADIGRITPDPTRSSSGSLPPSPTDSAGHPPVRFQLVAVKWSSIPPDPTRSDPVGPRGSLPAVSATSPTNPSRFCPGLTTPLGPNRTQWGSRRPLARPPLFRQLWAQTRLAIPSGPYPPPAGPFQRNRPRLNSSQCRTPPGCFQLLRGVENHSESEPSRGRAGCRRAVVWVLFHTGCSLIRQRVFITQSG